MARADRIPPARDPDRMPCRAWLPDAALAAGRTGRLLGELVGHWSAKWFRTTRLRPSGALGPAATLERGMQWRVLDADLAIGVPPGSIAAIATAMLGAASGEQPVSAADNRLFAVLAEACVDDLCRRLAHAFRLSAAARWPALGEGMVPEIAAPRACSIGKEGGAPLITLVAATDTVIACVKAAMPGAPPGNPLVPLADALGGQTVTLSAGLGRCAVPLADFAGLGIGDVLLFDRDVTAPLALAIDGVASREQCTVERLGARLDLKLLAPTG